jgi:hypothetical protein
MRRLVPPLLLAAAIVAAAAAAFAVPPPSPVPLPPDATHVAELYAWPQGSDLVMAMTVDPGAPPLATAGTALRFSTSTLYVFHVVAHGTTTDLKTYVVQFADREAAQWARVRGTSHGSGATDDLVGRVNTIADAGSPHVIRSHDGKVQLFAGPRDDPFFGAPNGGYAVEYGGFAACYGTAATPERCWLGACDRLHPDVGCRNGPTQAPYPADVVDERAGLNADAIVLEVPMSDFGASTKVDVWAGTQAQ